MIKLQVGEIELDVQTVPVYHREALFSPAGEYIATKAHLEVGAIYNPGSVAFKSVGNQPQASKGVLSRTTEKALRHYLLQPRRTIRLTFNGTEVFRCPTAGFDCDVQNGPLPTRVVVTQFEGERTMMVRFAVECMLTEVQETQNRPAGLGADSPLLSWHMEQMSGIDTHMFEERHYTVEAMFRRDKLTQLGTIPHDYLTNLMPPIPSGFQRVNVEVHQLADGVTVQASVVDKQQWVSHKFAHIAEIQVDATTISEAPGLDNIILSAGASGGSIIESQMDPFYESDDPQRHRRLQRWKRTRTKSRAFGTAVGGLYRVVPIASHTYKIAVFGTPECTRKELMTAGEALSLLMFNSLGLSGRSAVEYQVHMDLLNPILAVELRKTAGPAAGSPDAGSPWKRMRVFDNNLLNQNVFIFPAKDWGHYPTTKAAYGSRLEALVATSLHDAGTAFEEPELEARKVTPAVP